MLISRAKAEEAWTLLRTYARLVDEVWDSDEMCSIARVDAGTVKRAYHAASRHAHPDMGGDSETFARVDWAKHVLLRWILQDNSARPPEHKTRKCGNCNGSGYIQTMIGFKMGPRKQCQPCRGTGDADFEPDEGEAR